MKIVMKDIFLKQILSTQNNYESHIKTYHFYQKEKKLKQRNQKKKSRETCLLVCSIEDKEKYVIHISALKQALNNGLKLREVHRVIKFQQKAWLKSYTDITQNQEKNQKMNLKKISLS